MILAKKVNSFLQVYLSPIIFAMVLLFGSIQIQKYAMKSSTKHSGMPVEVLVFYCMFYACAATYFILKIILEYRNG